MKRRVDNLYNLYNKYRNNKFYCPYDWKRKELKMNNYENKEVYEYVKERYERKYNNQEFDRWYDEFLKIKDFKINENIFTDNPDFNNKIHFIMRTQTQYFITKAFESMKIDLTDSNTREDLENGNIGTPGRIAKMWCGANINSDDELMCGRWAKRPRLANFPNQDTRNKKIPITKRVDLISVCSHHAAPFSSTFRPDGQAIVSYIPKDKVLGISKLQRIVNWVSKRGWLQEDLTKAIYKEVSKAAETEDVYVGLINIEHSCESIRGANSKDGSFTSEYYGGRFNKEKVRNSIK
jgi:GTP cyclohydrolase I